jgi:hypothetical protein
LIDAKVKNKSFNRTQVDHHYLTDLTSEQLYEKYKKNVREKEALRKEQQKKEPENKQNIYKSTKKTNEDVLKELGEYYSDVPKRSSHIQELNSLARKYELEP